MKSENAEKMREAIEALTFLVFPLIAGTSEESFTAFRRVCQGWKGQLDNWEQLKNKEAEAFSAQHGKNNLPQLPSMRAVAADVSCGN